MPQTTLLNMCQDHLILGRILFNVSGPPYVEEDLEHTMIATTIGRGYPEEELGGSLKKLVRRILRKISMRICGMLPHESPVVRDLLNYRPFVTPFLHAVSSLGLG